MFDVKNVIYTYDGSYDGFLSCVFKSFEQKELPCAVASFEDSQPSLFSEEYISTNNQQAVRVKKSFARIGQTTRSLIEDAFLSNLKSKEICIIEFLQLAYEIGENAANMLAHKNVSPLVKAQRFLLNEAHLFKGFIRFSDYGDVLMAEIEPKCVVLPRIMPHFCARYPNENLVIYDKTHSMAIVSNKGRGKIIYVDSIELPSPSLEETQFRQMWKTFYDTIEIKERHNEKCRMTHMPKRYWGCMTEFCEDETALQKRLGKEVLGTFCDNLTDLYKTQLIG